MESNREANWTIAYKDEKLYGAIFYVYDLISVDNFTCVSNKNEAIRMCWSAAKVLAQTLKVMSGLDVYPTLL